MKHAEPEPVNPSAPRLGPPPRIAVITCAVLETEIAHFSRGLEHVVHIEILEQGLHNTPDKLRDEVQAAIGRIEDGTNAEAIVLGYGLCSRGTEGLRTQRSKLVIPRAHDCITILLGGKERYARYLEEHPGTYWYSPGWNRHHTPPGQERYEKLQRKYSETYDEDSAQYLMEVEQNWFKTYNRAAYVELGVGATKEDLAYTAGCAKWLGWVFDHQHGDPALLQALLAGEWDEDRFLVLEPGRTLRMCADERVIVSADAESPTQPTPATGNAPPKRPPDAGPPAA